MTKFNNTTEKIDFLKKYKLVPKTATELPDFYYFAPGSNEPITCDIIGYEDVFENWAGIIVQANNEIINIHSDCLLEMKTRGRAFYKNNLSTQNNKMDSNSYIVFDIETTGKNSKKDEIIEISAIKCTNQGIFEFSKLVKIDSIVPINITLLTGITNEMLCDAEPIETVLPEFLSFIGNHKLVGHNIKTFDIHCINNTCKNLGLPEVKNDLIDTLQIAKKALPGLDNYRLPTICNFYGIDTSNAHRALADCYMCNECYLNLLGKNETSYIEISSTDLTDSTFQAQLLSILQNTIVELELPERGLILQKNGGKYIKTASIYINEPPYPATKADLTKTNNTQSILKYQEKEDIIILTVKNNAFDDIPHPEDIQYKEKSAFVEVYFPLNHPDLYTYIKNIICYRIRHYISAADSFGCCSKFNECSDAMKCVHENKLYSTACTYRKNLENGKIFYGKNRNVD